MTTIKNNGGAVEIKPRRMSFPFSEMESSLYFKDNALLSAFGAALSGTFPPGEAEFIASVRLYQDKITDPELQQQIRGFIGQEGHHSHQHKQANEVLNSLGWDAQYVERDLEKSIKLKNAGRWRGRPKMRLAITVGMEHMTAIMAEYLLTNTEQFDSLDERVKELLFWHAVEEIEHKSVAFDVFMACENDQKFLRKAMRIANFMFNAKISIYIVKLMWKARRFPSWQEIKEFREFLFGEKGLVTQIKPAYNDYFKEGFHPWDHDNQHLIDEWKEKYYRPEHDLTAIKKETAA